jgi:thymidylate synthase (FAD)
MIFPNREIVDRYYVPLIYTACRTCYSELAPDDIFDRAVDGRITPEKQRELIGRVIESGHGSTIEHVVFTFAITGVSRTLSHQLVRHRAGVAFDQQSQRYVTYKKGASTMLPGTIAEADPELLERYEGQVEGALELYTELVDAGIACLHAVNRAAAAADLEAAAGVPVEAGAAGPFAGRGPRDLPVDDGELDVEHERA